MIQIDMEMPKTCGQCLCAMMDYDYNTARCRLKYDLCFDANSRDYSNRRLDGCPLHKVADTDTISRQDAIEHLKKRLYESALNNEGVVSETMEEIADNRIQIWIEELPPSPSRPQWISVTERLPEHSCQTLVTTKWDTEYSVEYGFYWGEDNKWGIITNNVIAWMPLPEPYQGGRA